MAFAGGGPPSSVPYTIVFRPLSGIYPMHLAQNPWTSARIVSTFVLYAPRIRPVRSVVRAMP